MIKSPFPSHYKFWVFSISHDMNVFTQVRDRVVSDLKLGFHTTLTQQMNHSHSDCLDNACTVSA